MQSYPLVPAVIQALVRPFAPSLWPLTPEALMDTARGRAGLADFGNVSEFAPAMERLLQGFRDEAKLSPVGRFLVG